MVEEWSVEERGGGGCGREGRREGRAEGVERATEGVTRPVRDERVALERTCSKLISVAVAEKRGQREANLSGGSVASTERR